MPEVVAPSLLAEINDGNSDTYFARQPESPEEVERETAMLGLL
jgi:hypothetical protein